MSTSKQLHYIATRPAAYAKFMATGRLPDTLSPSSPLIDLLLKLSPRERISITGVTVGPELGYSGSRLFPNAEAALRWMRPGAEMLEGQSWPAESWRNKRFAKVLNLSDLAAHAIRFPEQLKAKTSKMLTPTLPAADDPVSAPDQPAD